MDSNHERLVVLTRLMRHAQKEYFKTKQTSWLATAKTAEKEVDQLIEKIDEERNARQTKLFEKSKS